MLKFEDFRIPAQAHRPGCRAALPSPQQSPPTVPAEPLHWRVVFIASSVFTHPKRFTVQSFPLILVPINSRESEFYNYFSILRNIFYIFNPSCKNNILYLESLENYIHI